MKEICMLFGFGAGLVAGALLYKHSQDAKRLVNKGENAVKQEMENIKDLMKPAKNKGQTNKE